MIRACLAALVVLAGCAYRPAAPPPLAEGLRIVIAANDGRLVRSQLHLQEELAGEIASRLGWRLAPQGEAVLALHLDPELIDASRHAELRIADRWRITVQGDWSLVTAAGERHAGRFVASGHADDLRQEQAALEDAARTAAAQIVDGLENALRRP